MWKAWLIRLAAAYIDRLINKWLLQQTDKRRELAKDLMADLEAYLRFSRNKTALTVADLIHEWRT